MTIGTFDGVHIGHASLVRRARELADTQGATAHVVAMCFDPHPLTRLHPAAAPARLTTFERRAALLGEAGADEVIRLEPTPALLALSPEEFIDHVARDLSPRAIVEGAGFRFGHGRAGDESTLRTLCQPRGIEVHILPLLDAVMTDGTLAPASSTLARWLVNEGRMLDAAAVLGRDYEVEGTVEKGDQRGRTLGYPTANLNTELLLPADGVYAGSGILPDGRELPAAISVGTKPMFNGSGRLLEAHLIGRPNLSNLPDYGWPLRVKVSRWLRDQLTFDTVESLIEQIERDCRRAAPAGAIPA